MGISILEFAQMALISQTIYAEDKYNHLSKEEIEKLYDAMYEDMGGTFGLECKGDSAHVTISIASDESGYLHLKSIDIGQQNRGYGTKW